VNSPQLRRAEAQTAPLTALPGEMLVDEIIGNMRRENPQKFTCANRWKFHASSYSLNAVALEKNAPPHFFEATCSACDRSTEFRNTLRRDGGNPAFWQEQSPATQPAQSKHVIRAFSEKL
jgi:hypothetical protein